MALVVKDRVKETTTTTGTGTITLAGAATGFQSFTSALSDGDTTYYAIVEDETAWEVGLGTFTASGTTLSRDTILESSNAGAAINLTAEADVFITYPAEKSVYLNASGDIDLTGNIVFEGSTADDFETTVTVADPTADRTITLPDQTGTAMLWQSGFLEGGDDYFNIPIGDDALSSLTTSSGKWNVGIGKDAGENISTGVSNICIGYLSNQILTSGTSNVSIGTSTGFYNTTSDYNTAVGGNALSYSSGASNVGVGFQAIRGYAPGASSGSGNVGIGHQALVSIYTGDYNTALGYLAGDSLTTASNNVAIGNSSMTENTTDTNSVAVGYASGRGNFLTGGTYLGSLAGNYNSSSKDYQTAIGYNAMNDCNGDYSVAVGANSMTDGDHYRSVAVGYLALSRTSTSSPYYNVAIGYDSGDNIYSGDYNVFVGWAADTLSNSASSSVAIGAGSGTATGGVSIGYQTMASGTSSSAYNINIGYQAGYDVDGGDYNSFLGYQSGYAGGTGSYNVGSGYRSLYSLTSAAYAAALGNEALYSLTEGDDNSAFGAYAGRSVNTGANNTFLGYNAGYSQGGSTTNALTTGSNVTCVGNEAMPSGATATNEITLGDNNITSLRCNVQTISSLSDERDKTAIADISYGLDFINDMRPVQFTWNRRDGSLGAKTDIGFIAQELHDVELDHSSSSRTRLVNWSNPEKLEADYVRSYPILVKAVQELSAKCDALEARIAELEGT